ncbi:MAG TPA: polymer-forming cytoskeletal protein [Woeseiaceae bacterium]|nr:polymer-forming cytoskeletal protein [Woeseiaceae bacterium]
MFERGKKDEGMDESVDQRSAVPQRRVELPRSGAASPSGECAVIGRSIEINGDVRGNEDLRIEGDVSGTVELRNSNLTIGKEGKVRADVYAKSIMVDGTTEGDLYASERIVVHISAHVRGNITAPKVGIEEGAKFKGSIEMDQDAVEKALGKANMKAAARPTADRPPGKPADAKVGQKDIVKEAASGPGPQAGVR